IDQFLDMGRTATNVVGNSIATAVVAKLEGDKVADTEELPEPVLIKSTQEQTIA
ncbi:dicarboxylate/amino acid:cation symporter, partial [Acinetobacter baumannii]